jgi:hypothetical protein
MHVLRSGAFTKVLQVGAARRCTGAWLVAAASVALGRLRARELGCLCDAACPAQRAVARFRVLPSSVSPPKPRMLPPSHCRCPPAAPPLQMRLVRGVSGKQFTGALDESLRPLLRCAGRRAACSPHLS